MLMRRLLAVLSVLSACGDDAPALPPGAATIAIDSATLSVVGFTWGRNNDCPAQGASVISVTLRGHQSDATDFGLGFCLPRPDLIGAAAIDLADTSLVLLVGASARLDNGCMLGLAPDAVPTGSVTFSGFSTHAGADFRMTLSGQVDGIEQCGSGPSTPVTMVLGGQVLVEPQP
jgi:hypothetical protein